MKIDRDECIGCGACHPYCPVNAIVTIDGKEGQTSEIMQEECVECGVCLRAEVCPTDAIVMPELDWPRSVRAMFSDPITQHPSTRLEGRGTEEMKTNDVTGRLKRGMAGLAVEMGRPGVGTSFRDIQTVCMVLAGVGVDFEHENPINRLIKDKRTGEINDDVLDEKALSAIIEFSVNNNRLEEALKALKRVSNRIETVFSLCLISRVYPDGSIPVEAIARVAGFSPRPNTKTNVGLGRPLKEDI
jgi:Pyruvate/2-oxoacid:ferredoxin oxidoreductase delta subunit